MQKAEFVQVFQIAQEHKYVVSAPFEEEAVKALGGMDVDKTRRIATKEQAAWLLNYQCRYMNGQYDMDALAHMKELYKRVDLLN